jgi:hypothetical protein
MKTIKIKNTPEFLLDSGLLFEINRKVLHPFGLALEIIVNDDNEVVFGNIWDYRTDPEGITYDDESYSVGNEKFKKFMEEFGANRLKSRERRLGFIIQPEPGPEPKFTDAKDGPICSCGKASATESGWCGRDCTHVSNNNE